MTRYMYPETLDGLEVDSPAERLLFREFKEQLSDEFRVFHSVRWLGNNRLGRPPSDGEIDFIIAHDQLGILLLEVKGGIIGFDSGDGYYSQKRDGSIVSIKDPFDQVKRNKYALGRLIKSLPNWPGPIPSLGHAVAFPDGSLDLGDLGPQARPEIVMLQSDVAGLEAWLRKCFAFWSGEAGSACIGPDGMSALTDLLRKSWLMREPKLGEIVQGQLTAINHYTRQQFALLDFINQHPRALIQGCAGSGKTTLAIEKARRLASQGHRTLLTCYNKNLADYIRASLGNTPRLKVQSFHGLCQEYASKAELTNLPNWDDSRPDFYDRIMPETLVEAAAILPADHLFDAIVVDEGQDFSRGWWAALESLLLDVKNGIFYVFYDDNQMLYNRDYSLPVEGEPFRLTVNCRNTVEIHRMVRRFYRSQAEITAGGVSGKPVKIITYEDHPNAIKAALTEVLTDLVYNEKVASRDIVILTPRGFANPPLDEVRRAGAFTPVSKRSTAPNDIYTTSVRLFKGLESPVVIIVVPKGSENILELLYVGFSRAIVLLVILMDESLDEDLRARIEKLDN